MTLDDYDLRARVAGGVRGVRWRLARRLVGNFVTLPNKNGVFIVAHAVGPANITAVYTADKFRLKTWIAPFPNRDDSTYGFFPSRRKGRFVGTLADD